MLCSRIFCQARTRKKCRRDCLASSSALRIGSGFFNLLVTDSKKRRNCVCAVCVLYTCVLKIHLGDLLHQHHWTHFESNEAPLLLIIIYHYVFRMLFSVVKWEIEHVALLRWRSDGPRDYKQRRDGRLVLLDRWFGRFDLVFAGNVYYRLKERLLTHVLGVRMVVSCESLHTQKKINNAREQSTMGKKGRCRRCRLRRQHHLDLLPLLMVYLPSFTFSVALALAVPHTQLS